jgi:pilus assembly protein Flp/PilA
MKALVCHFKKFLSSDEGPTTVEYAIMLAMIVMVCLVAIQALGTKTSAKFLEAANGLS